MKVNFTKALLENATASSSRVVLWDQKTSGLQCRISSSGIKTFSVLKRIKTGRLERVTLGKFPEMSIEHARNEAAKINALIACGGNAAEVKRVNKGEMTFSELFTEYLERHSKVKKRTWEVDVRNYKLYLEKPLANKRLSEIKRSDIGYIHSKITQQNKYTKYKPASAKKGSTANRILALISSVFGWSISVGISETNPARGIKRNAEKSRDRFMNADELPRFFKALKAERNDACRDFIFLLLLTGARKSNVISMRWEDVSLEQKEWRIPHTKNGEPQVIPLVDQAIQILNRRRKKQSVFVFPGKGKYGHLVEPKKAWRRILEEAKISNLTIHDLRRTFGSWQVKTGSSLAIVGKSLGHKSLQSTSIYARLDLDPVRKSMESATEAILLAGRNTISIREKSFENMVLGLNNNRIKNVFNLFGRLK